MNIAVFLASTEGNDPAFRAATAEVGRLIAEGGHTLVFGGTRFGLMGICCDAVLEHGGKVIAVEPNTEFIRAKLHPGATEVIWTNSMAERKSTMNKLADAFIAMPGGPGTFDEAGDIMALHKTGEMTKPLVFMNTNGYYEPLKVLFENMRANGFWGIGRGLELIADTPNEAFSFINESVKSR